MEALVHRDGRFVFAGRIVRAALGARGVIGHKMEGDHATPAGLLPLRRVLYRADRVRPSASTLPLEPLAPNDGWCDDPTHRDYNRQVRLPHEARCEELWRSDFVYDVIGVLGWNDAPVERGRGSAIFLHAARPDYAPTEGCIALALPDLLMALQTGLRTIRVVAD